MWKTLTICLLLVALVNANPKQELFKFQERLEKEQKQHIDLLEEPSDLSVELNDENTKRNKTQEALGSEVVQVSLNSKDGPVTVDLTQGDLSRIISLFFNKPKPTSHTDDDDDYYGYPAYPTYPVYPSYPNYPSNPTYPTYPGYPHHPGHPHHSGYPHTPRTTRTPTTTTSKPVTTTTRRPRPGHHHHHHPHPQPHPQPYPQPYPQSYPYPSYPYPYYSYPYYSYSPPRQNDSPNNCRKIFFGTSVSC